MKFLVLGKTKEKISAIGLGFWQAGSKLWKGKTKEISLEIEKGLQIAIEKKINLLDTAEIYGYGESEKLLGKVLRNLGRDNFFIATKIAGFRWRSTDIEKAIINSKKRLGIDQVDLIQHHWPPPFYANLCKLAWSMEKLIDNGHVRYIGVSNYNTQLLSKILECTKKYDIVSNQIQYNLAYRVAENKLIPFMKKQGITLIAWSPLAKGALAGLRKPVNFAQRMDSVFRRAARDHNLQKTLNQLAAKYHVTPAQFSLAWLIEKNAVPIPGFKKSYRVESYAKAAELKLKREDLEKIDTLTQKYVEEGKDYSGLSFNRLLPGTLMNLFLRIIGGV